MGEASPVEQLQSSGDKFYAMSDNFGEKSELHHLVDITCHRNIKGVKGRQYYCIWADHEPTWEFEKLIKSQADGMISMYWLNIGKPDFAVGRKLPTDFETLLKNKN